MQSTEPGMIIAVLHRARLKPPSTLVRNIDTAQSQAGERTNSIEPVGHQQQRSGYYRAAYGKPGDATEPILGFTV
ncbi:hypothetical protein Cagg_3103 [Chloroflexus aggregans DSM 9485]|uniref:Uncharacterized protein n=1 Tax=Chloroflexus aggregans (strain MD-66 / DSM 9485) TaxID=326427 RepID=B8G7C6_CHLAD|nr:hypothetical protein Cagg_3103 [Chloroflexus aggregans DSM 9485]